MCWGLRIDFVFFVHLVGCLWITLIASRGFCCHADRLCTGPIALAKRRCVDLLTPPCMSLRMYTSMSIYTVRWIMYASVSGGFCDTVHHERQRRRENGAAAGEETAGVRRHNGFVVHVTRKAHDRRPRFPLPLLISAPFVHPLYGSRVFAVLVFPCRLRSVRSLLTQNRK